MIEPNNKFDPYVHNEMAHRVETAGVTKAHPGIPTMFALAALAGAFLVEATT